MNKQNVRNFLLPLVATRQVRQGGYLHKNIFDVQHLHQSQIICIIVVLKVLKHYYYTNNLRLMKMLYIENIFV